MEDSKSSVKYDTTRNDFKMTVIFSGLKLYGLEDKFENTLKVLETNKDIINIIFVVDRESFNENTNAMLIRRFPNFKIVLKEGIVQSHSQLFNEGFKHIKTPYVYFAWAGSFIDSRIFGFARNEDYERDVVVIRNKTLNKVKSEITFNVFYGWLQSVPLYELNNVIVSSKVISEVGEFETTGILQRYFYWEWILRLARGYNFYSLGIGTGDSDIMLEKYPIKMDYNFDYDLIQKYVVRLRKLPYYHTDINNLQMFLKDIDYSELLTFYNKVKSFNIDENINFDNLLNRNEQDKKVFNICLIGGPWEYHHMQICFYNYLDKLYGQSIVNYKVSLDEIVEVKDVEKSDLVIVCRSRNSRILDIIDYCNNKNITTLYMVDDNWLTIAKDVPELYGTLFVPGNPQFDTFVECLKRSNYVITYNKYLYSDIKEYNNKVYLFPLNIDLDYYTESVEKNDEKITIGYSGSLRHTSTVFSAICNVARRNSNVEILYFGSLSAEQMKLFNGINVKFTGFQTYALYCKAISNNHIDILVAPLENNRYSMSKCPNKFLEIGAINGAGIYRNIYPYSDVIVNEENGLLIDNDTTQEWEEKIEKLCNDKILLNKIKVNCRNEIINRYKTEINLPKFCLLIDKLVNKI